MKYGLHGRVSNSIVAGGMGEGGRGFDMFSSTIHIEILCIKLEINQGYTMMHVQPIIKKKEIHIEVYSFFYDINKGAVC